MIIVTGGAGLIGSNIVKGLNARGYTRILIVDDLTDGRKYKNILNCEFLDYMDKKDFLTRITDNKDLFSHVTAVFHEGACSDTTEWNGEYMMRNNYDYSKTLLHYCLNRKIQFLYASSAAVYGGSQVFQENPAYEVALTVYGYSKLLFDKYVRRMCFDSKDYETTQVAGFRYFNVYGPGEMHKGPMASVALHFNNQLKTGDTVKLFSGDETYEDGEQRRDFIYVKDLVDVNLWFLEHPDVTGIFNVGTGHSESFNAVATAVMAWYQRGKIEYIPFPDHLKGHYQRFTEADISLLRSVGYSGEFKTVAEGVKAYLDCLAA